jgi:hypothetical protein
MKKLTIEEKVATKMSALLSDMRLNLKMIGSYIALQQPMEIHDRLAYVTEIMEQQMTSLDEYYAQGKKDSWGNDYNSQDPTDWNPEDDHSV